MSPSLQRLKSAVRDFASRPIEEDIDPDELRDVLGELEGELDLLYESPARRATEREAMTEAMRGISEVYGSRSQPL